MDNTLFCYYYVMVAINVNTRTRHMFAMQYKTDVREAGFLQELNLWNKEASRAPNEAGLYYTYYQISEYEYNNFSKPQVWSI